ncbi:hypothetical protein DSCO28_46660 [Desulfosarcina ovata subsp. sediminis]|uniref:Uncharacterized protein n=2 Tax=Desulfosarcina ovata TaxID=83564 RepID=A0A5K8ADH0_9BACT|nr:hypothetical protein DSCO28_46660 [Desulfosarcina ovata subsp. sediminis]BBO90599.1 hypothetical protein DSCOOX_37790 [Desulfosarcina ovata subsp. ovata]
MKSTLRNHWLSGEKKGGYIMRTPEDGFNGIAGISWEEDVQTMIVRSKDGNP